MTLIEFIKSQVSNDTSIGELAEDVVNDRNFPYKKPEQAIIAYLEFMTRSHNNTAVFDELMKAYEMQKNNPVALTDLDAQFSPLKAEQWNYLKTHFPVDRAILVGSPGDIYRVYAVDSISNTALTFDIHGRKQLNELSIIEVANVYIGEITSEVSILEAIEAIKATRFTPARQPVQPNFMEMLLFLQSRITK